VGEGLLGSGTEDFRPLLDALVDELRAGGALRSPEVERALRAVPRHRFLPGVDLAAAYRDEVVVLKRSPDGAALSTSSQPGLMARMLEALEVRPGHAVLEIGTGSGYNAALLAELVGPEGRVVTVELDPEVSARARECLEAAGYGRVIAVCGDGRLGYPPGAPYDRITVTAAAERLEAAWLEQLRDGGYLQVPLAAGPAEAIATFVRQGDVWRCRSVLLGSFVPLRGAPQDRGQPSAAEEACRRALEEALQALGRRGGRRLLERLRPVDWHRLATQGGPPGLL
jgi:protein-L-isoaspartate(D-aspartate) O-methyltransferase